MMNSRVLLAVVGACLWVQGLYGQFITASEVETWVTKEMPSADFNLNSAYVYLINGNVLQNVFAGEELSRSQRKDLDLSKGDYPQYMYLAASIPDPYNEQNSFTVPLMIQDVRNPQDISRMTGYGGRVLENIPDEVLRRGDIVAKVKFEAFKGNSSEEFWKKTAKISIDLGKTAASLLTAPLTGNFMALTNQIIPQVTKGLTSLEKADQDPRHVTSEFYVRLLDNALSALYQERLVAATLYKIHWDVAGRPPQSSFFRNKNPQSVEELRRLVNHNNSSFILIVHTKSEYNTDHSELVYNQSYIDKKTKDYRKIQNAEKKEVEKSFLETLKLAVELKSQVDQFQNSLNSRYPDWLAYSKVIDLYYDIRTLRNEQMKYINQVNDPVLRQNYTALYQNVVNDADLWFSTPMLSRSRSIAEYLVGASPDYNYSGMAPPVLYKDIELLDFYRDRVKQTEIVGKLPKEIESLKTYGLVNQVLHNLESALFTKDFRVPPSLGPEEQKRWLLDKATNQYPLCKSCSKWVGERITEIENLSHEQNVAKYREISANYYARLGCFEQLYGRLDSMIRANTDSLTLAPFMLENLKKDQAELDRLADAYTELVGRDYTVLSRQELSDLLSRYYVYREKMLAVTDRLKGLMRTGDVGCL